MSYFQGKSRKCPICGDAMNILQYMDIENGYSYAFKWFRCDTCNSTHSYEVIDSLEPVSIEKWPKAFGMNVWAEEEYEDFRFPRACPFCEKALFWVLVTSNTAPNLALFEWLECAYCKSYFDKTVLLKLKDYVNEGDEWGWRRWTPKETEEAGIKEVVS